MIFVPCLSCSCLWFSLCFSLIVLLCSFMLFSLFFLPFLFDFSLFLSCRIAVSHSRNVLCTRTLRLLPPLFLFTLRLTLMALSVAMRPIPASFPPRNRQHVWTPLHILIMLYH